MLWCRIVRGSQAIVRACAVNDPRRTTRVDATCWICQIRIQSGLMSWRNVTLTSRPATMSANLHKTRLERREVFRSCLWPGVLILGKG